MHSEGEPKRALGGVIVVNSAFSPSIDYSEACPGYSHPWRDPARAKISLDCHLMIENPDQYIPDFAEAGADWISVHQEACRHLNRTLHLIKSHECLAGVVLNPATPMETLSEVLDIVDYVLVMSVNPGFGAQKFIPGALHKMRRLAEIRAARGYSYRIEVDGGVGLDTIGDIVRAGAEILVAGNAVFGKGDPKVNAAALLEAARSASLQR